MISDASSGRYLYKRPPLGWVTLLIGHHVAMLLRAADVEKIAIRSSPLGDRSLGGAFTATQWPILLL